ncbi:MAG: helical backbone metal receptor [Desulfomonilaceae bacterium]|jgi:iron complex transport system substrate-binding protein
MAMFKYAFILFFSIIALLTVMGKVWSDSANVVCVKDSLGALVCVQASPKRIVCLAPSLTELVFELKAGSRLVGRTTKCNIPEAAKAVTNIGSYGSPDFEKLMSVRTDLVLAPKTGIKPEFIQRLKSLGVPVYVDDSSNIEQIEQNINNVGKLLGSNDEAGRIVNDIRVRRISIRKLMDGVEKTTVLFVIGVRPLVVAGGRSFLGSLVREAGGSNIAENTTVEYPKFSIEEVIKCDPDLILMLDKECREKECVDQWKDFSYLKAVKNKRVYELDADLMARPGVRTIDGLEKLVKFLHPEIPGIPTQSNTLRSDAKDR